MADPKSYTKYQVYFFLYLAVICELLIIIVERDDAEAGWLKEKRALQQMTQDVINEVISNRPVARTNGTTQMRVGEHRTFTFAVNGMGLSDIVSTMPHIEIMRGGAPVGRLEYGRDISDADNTESSNGNGARTFTFEWTAPAVGDYSFDGFVGTNRISLAGNGMVKIGNLVMPMDVIRRYVPNINEVIDTMSTINSSLLVTVIPTEDQVGVHAQDLVTAAGFPAINSINVQGSTADKVSVHASTGRVELVNGRLQWTATFITEGKNTVTINAGRTTGGTANDRAAAAFTVEVKNPTPVKKLPDRAFEKEPVKWNVQVNGLEDVSQYSWVLSENGREARRGTGPFVDYTPSGKGTLALTAYYQGKTYPVAGHGTSEWTYTLQSLGYRIGTGFTAGGTYAPGQQFVARAMRCGNVPSLYSEAVTRRDVDVEVTAEDGTDLLDEESLVVTPSGDGRYSTIEFRIKGRKTRDDIEATVTIRVGSERSKTRVTLGTID